MRVIGEIEHSEVKITMFHWNNKYLIKFERGMLEQTYKFSEFDVTGEAEIKEMIDDSFITKVVQRFTEMGKDHATLLDY
ncbi:MAG: hypothetical protein RIF33_21475 [Cyclobacteriaceae bacterium]